MGKARLMVVEDDGDISKLLHLFFTNQGYDVDLAPNGLDALEKVRVALPHLIVLDIMLPDIDGYEVCRRLRTSTRTSHIPVIFLTQRDERSDRLQGLELGADDYITKPFDIDELRLRVQGAIRRSERESLTDPRSGLPAGRLIEEQLRNLLKSSGWAYIDMRLNAFETFKDVYGFVAADDVLRSTAMLINEVVNQNGTPTDFIGHAGGDNFAIITQKPAAAEIVRKVKLRFAEEVLTHYNFVDRDQGFIRITTPEGKEEQAPLMSITAGVVSPDQQAFTDIREITEMAAEMRRQDNPTAGG